MSGFAGLVALNSAIDVTVVAKNSSKVPTDPDGDLATYRIYGPAGLADNGTLPYKDTGNVTNCPPANPTVYTSVGHNLTVGTKVTIKNVGGNIGANGTFDVSAVTTNTFTVATDTSGGGAYTTGGAWHATGVLDFNYSPTVAKNFASSVNYTVYCYCKFSSVTTALDVFQFQVT